MMYKNVSKVIICESIEQMDLGDVLGEFDDPVQYILGSRETITAYISRDASLASEIAPSPVPAPEYPPITVFRIESTCADNPKYQECMELFSGYVDTDLFFTKLLNRGLDYLCFMNPETCVIVHTPSTYRVKSKRLESEVKQLESEVKQFQNIPNWIVRFFNRGGR